MANPQPRTNQFLASLSRVDYARLAPSLKPIALAQGILLHEPGDEINQVYFPQTGMISLLRVMRSGKAIETAVVGQESAVGIMTGFGVCTTLSRAMVQLPVTGMQSSAGPFRKAVHESIALQALITEHNELLLFQAQTTAACNALHLIEARFCRWILQASDRSDGNPMPLTQALLSQMLGVRRTSVSGVANKLQAAGAIEYVRGTVRIVDRKRLKALSCECYGALLAKTATLRK
jgi:CRP-like cAMP-binding protein